MNKKIIVLAAFIMLTVNFYGQKRPDREKIKTLKVAFITERIDLSSNEAQVFWPIYNEHEAKMASFRKKERTEIRANLKNVSELSESDADKLLQLALELENNKAKTSLEYYKKINVLISSKKTMLLMKAEEDFKRRLIKEYRHKKNSGNNQK